MLLNISANQCCNFDKHPEPMEILHSRFSLAFSSSVPAPKTPSKIKQSHNEQTNYLGVDVDVDWGFGIGFG